MSTEDLDKTQWSGGGSSDEDGGPGRFHRACSRDTLEASDSFNEEAAKSMMFLSYENLEFETKYRDHRTSMSSETESELSSPARVKVYMMTDSEDDDDVYVPDWKTFQDFKEGITEEEHSINSDDDDDPVEVEIQLRSFPLNRKRTFNIELNTKMDALTQEFDVIPAKMRRVQYEE